MKDFLTKNTFHFLIFIFLISLNLSQINTRLLSTLDDDDSPNQNCFLIQDNTNTKYDLTDLSSERRSLTTKDGKTILYQFCKNIDDTKSSVILKSDSESSNSTRLAGNVKGETNSKNRILVGSNKTLIIHLAEGDKCSSKENYNFTINLKCNADLEYANENLIEPTTTSPCNYVLEAESKYACGIENAYITLDLTFKIIFGILLIILGNVFGIFGFKYLNYSFYVVCMLLFAVLLIYIFVHLLNITSNVVFWILIAVGAILGFLLAFFLTKKKKLFLSLYMAILGGAFGYLLGTVIYEIIFLNIQTDSQKTMYLIVVLCCMIIGIVLGIFAPRKICFVSTSTIGGYCFMRGIALLLDSTDIKYVDESKVFDYARTENFEQIKEMISGYFFLFPVIFILFTVVYIVVQHKINPKNEGDDYRELGRLFNKEVKGLRIETMSSSFSEDGQMIEDE